MSKPLHPKASAFQRVGLFEGLESFDKLEARIAALSDEKASGDAFEVFAEAYLVTQRRHDLPKVWPLTAVPTDVLCKLALPLNDYGVDGVAQTALGGFDVYQVKFWSGRQPLTWRELSTFMGLADSASIHNRVLFTNCDDFQPAHQEAPVPHRHTAPLQPAAQGQRRRRATRLLDGQAAGLWRTSLPPHLCRSRPARHSTSIKPARFAGCSAVLNSNPL